MSGQALCDNYPRCTGTAWTMLVQKHPGDPVMHLCSDCAEPYRLTAHRWEWR